MVAPSPVQITVYIGFTGHRNKIAKIEDLEKIKFRFGQNQFVWVHGGAEGFDTQVEKFARANGIRTEVIRPDYKNYPVKEAPLIRNREIVDKCAVMFACWDGRKTGGTWYTIQYAQLIYRTIFMIAAVDPNE